MLKKVKKWLGIEGVRISVEVPDDIFLREKKLSGSLIFESKQDSVVSELRLRLIEKYSRGRRHSKLIDEYILGAEVLDAPIHLYANEPQSIPFEVHFEPLQSEMDTLESKNILMKGLVRTAKLIRNVQSTYRLEIEADVEGMAISPLVKKEVKIIS
ncbi:hypothetical protein KUV50_09835 [Membranicola marinus]|uniref:Uncharacterized protein n=1 Tax=Membranihabitans marinus TaxID=1227546 RepID=A0A953HMM8_9BACT|nr:hypothetical protein [Membranihabitans marinus]MBY5958432.1 hypothetical protein [Membranihabitans marinus]